MIDLNTGKTVYEIVQSFDTNNNPITGVTFDLNFYINGQLNTAITPNVSLINNSAATYSVSWSSDTYGYHQFYLRNQTTNVMYISELYNVNSGATVNSQPIVYVGL
jgi:hypothetical protein